jgi:hypothetical protein
VEIKERKSPTMLVLIILAFFTTFLGLLILPTYHFMLNEESTYGRVIEWSGSEVEIRYDLPGQDSMSARMKYVYTRDQKAIKKMDSLKIFYNSKRQNMVDIDGVRKYTFPLPMTIVFLLSLYITVDAVFKRYSSK